jgi:hypothetical protein
VNAERTLSNLIAALTAIATALATVAGIVPEHLAELVVMLSTGAALLAGNLREWRAAFFGAGAVGAAALGAALGASACGPRLEALPRIDFVGESASLESSFEAPASVFCAEGSGCAGELEGVGSVVVHAGGSLVVGDQSWPMEGEARAYARAGEDGADVGAMVCIDSAIFSEINKVLALVDAFDPSRKLPRIPDPLCAESR